MAAEIEIGPVREDEFEALLPLIAAYQRFYEVARARGAAWLEWATAPDNHTAQRLYDSMTSEKSTWLSYELDV